MKPLEAVRIAKPEANLVLEMHLDELHLTWVPEFRFCETRRWRADYAITTLKTRPTIAWIKPKPALLEIEGGIYTSGRHTRGRGFQADMEKYNMATALGFKVFRFSTQDVLTGRAKAFLAEHWLCR